MGLKSSWVRGLGVFAAVAALLLIGALPASAGPVGTASGFEDDDGNLIINSTFDWNSFAPTDWDMGTAPFRTTANTASGWDFVGLEDAEATTSDTAFKGGTKQDDNCATVITGKAPNKDDLKRAYVSHKTVPVEVSPGVFEDHTFLNLAWVRIPQNTTSPSAHIGFEFNQSDAACPAASDGLVQRTVGDMLIVYDFTGGAADTPTLTLRRWVDTGVCEVGSDSPPCWGPSTDLTALGFAEARVNTSLVGPVDDALTAPPPPATASITETLQLNEFGEAGIDLTAAQVFSSAVCTAFGKTYAVSRSSGNSATAQMKDLVGPGDINIANCGQVIIRKVTSPSPDATDTSFAYTTTGGSDLSDFDLKNGESKDFGTSIHSGSYSVTETDPGPTFKLTSIDCSASNVTPTTDTATGTVSFDLGPGDSVDCTYTNTLQLGAIKISKTSSKSGGTALGGATFSITGPNSYSASVTTDSDGTKCVDSLPFGDYTVKETAAPTGYAIDDPSDHTVTVDNNAKCSDDPYVGETISFSDTPLTDITATATTEAVGGTKSKITCVNSTAANVGDSPQGFGGDVKVTANGLKPGKYTCTIDIDP
jgi:hypothetical protein